MSSTTVFRSCDMGNISVYDKVVTENLNKNFYF